MLLACEECNHVTDDADGWIAKVMEDDEELVTDPGVVFYCPTCAEREFEFVSPRSLTTSVTKTGDPRATWTRTRVYQVVTHGCSDGR